MKTLSDARILESEGLNADADRLGVMHLTDTLLPGGAEQMAVNLVNAMPRRRYRMHLCTTRREGPLAAQIDPAVGRCCLKREHRFDLLALGRLLTYIKRNRIDILHGHGNSLFIAALASLFPPYPRVIWHEHYGAHAVNNHAPWPFRFAVKRVSGVIAVNQPLAEWSRRNLRVPDERVWYIPNFVGEPEPNGEPCELPETPGPRIVSVANFRAEKDQLTLIRAMALVVQRVPAAQLLLVGTAIDPAYLDLLKLEIERQALKQHVHFLGLRPDVPAILGACDIGVLSSAAEGLPMALLEYGLAGLGVVATDVGQCADVLGNGHAGWLVPPASAEELAAAIVELLLSSDLRSRLGGRLKRRVADVYCAERVIKQICAVYEAVMSAPTRQMMTEDRVLDRPVEAKFFRPAE
jgi:glycosyltransferase involved in cell wall biosynthesis